MPAILWCEFRCIPPTLLARAPPSGWTRQFVLRTGWITVYYGTPVLFHFLVVWLDFTGGDAYATREFEHGLFTWFGRCPVFGGG